MPIRKTITVTLTTRGDVDLPCTASCPDLALSTDGPTVASALEALAKAIEFLPRAEEPAAQAPQPAEAQPETPPNPPGVVLKALEPLPPTLTSRGPRKRTRRVGRVLRAS
jgi:hypothetical protein